MMTGSWVPLLITELKQDSPACKISLSASVQNESLRISLAHTFSFRDAFCRFSLPLKKVLHDFHKVAKARKSLCSARSVSSCDRIRKYIDNLPYGVEMHLAVSCISLSTIYMKTRRSLFFSSCIIKSLLFSLSSQTWMVGLLL